jgi:ABC-2 type transport system ATP-binding protein
VSRPPALPIALRGTSKWYGAVVGLNDVSLDVPAGITGLLGPNGSGKSTLLKLVTGQLRPSLGEVRVLGKPVWRSPGARRRLGFAPEVDAFPRGMTVRAFVRAMARLSGLRAAAARRKTDAVLERTGMAAYAAKRLDGCSKGMRQRAKLAQALVHDPEVLVLDEPFNGVDPPGRAELAALLEELRREGKTILLSSHILHEVETLADRIVLLSQGRVLATGSLARIRDLIEEHPLTVRIACEPRRALACALLAAHLVVGVSLGDAAPRESAEAEGAGRDGAGADRGDLIVKVGSPERFFRELPRLVSELRADVERLEALDASVEAVFDYLIGSSGFAAERGGGS